MKMVCVCLRWFLFAFVVFVAFKEVFPGPVPEGDALDTKDPAEIKKEIVAKVFDALNTGEGKQALQEILDHKNKNDADKGKEVEVVLDVQDNDGKNVKSIQLAKKSAENQQEDVLRNLIMDNVKDALEKGEGKKVIEQLVDGDDEDDDEDLKNKDDVPAAIENELKQEVDTTNPDPKGDAPNDASIDWKANDAKNAFKFEEVTGNNKDAENKAASNAGYFVSEPFTTDEAGAKVLNDIQNDEAFNGKTDANPAVVNNDPDTTEPQGSVNNAADTTVSQDSVDNGYFVSEPFAADDVTAQDIQNDGTSDYAPDYDIAGKAVEDVNAAALNPVPASSDSKAKDTSNMKDH